MDSVRWGVLGAARIAREQVIPAIRRSGCGEVVAVSSAGGRARSYAEELGLPRAYDSHDDLLADPDVDAVYLALPNSLHARWIVRAARAGKHVLCEKPLVLDGRELEQVDEVVAGAGVQLTEAFMYRHHPRMARLRELLDSGALGDLVAVQAQLHFGLARTSDPDIRLRPDMGGGSLLDLGCYPLDLFGALTGRDPDDVAAVAVREEPRGVDVRTAAVLRYGDVPATLDCSFDAPMTSTATVVGSRGVVTLTDVFRSDLTGGVGTPVVERDGGTERIEVAGDQYADQVRAFTASLQDRAAADSDAELSRRTVRTLERVARAAGPDLTSPDGTRQHSGPRHKTPTPDPRPQTPGDKHVALYIDSADRDLIAEVWSSGVFAGVTTNPTILDRSGLGQRDVPELHAWLSDLGVGRVYLQVLGRSRDEMLRHADELRSLGPVTVKVPATAEGYAAARVLVEQGAPVLLTAVYHPVQALMARDCGIQGVAPYVGRMTDAGRDGVGSVTAMQQAIGSQPTRILAASLRSTGDIVRLAAAGVPDFTLGGELARAVLDDDLTRSAVEEFEAAAARHA